MSTSAAEAAVKVTAGYLRALSASSPLGADLAMQNATDALDAAPPLPSVAPASAPMVDDDPDDNLIEVGPIEIGDVNNSDESDTTDDSAPGDDAAEDEADTGDAPDSAESTDDVDTRSTAFEPDDLSMLTEIEMPDEPGRWIRVDLSEQMLIAYVGDKPIRGFIVSTGLPATPTVTGTFRIRMKVRSQTMVGGEPALGNYYNLANVQWVQYFYQDYGFHGTYWHNNFGHPMSHGCVNMTNADAKWLFDWAGPQWDGETVWYPSSQDNPGTLVIVHE